jgi:hypothetical protein
MARAQQGALVQYSVIVPPAVLAFSFNPQTISRTRSVTVKTGSSPATRGGFDFSAPTETARAAQGVEMQPESFSIDILFDAGDRIAEGQATARQFGVQPEIDLLRTMVEPKVQGPDGLQTLASLEAGGSRAHRQAETASVLLFVWGVQVLPVFLTGVTQNEVQHLPNLAPYRAEIQLSMQAIESRNPFYLANRIRQVAFAGMSSLPRTIDGLESLT